MASYALPIVFLLAGAILTALGCANLKSTRRKQASWLALRGSVVGLQTHVGDQGRTMYAPTYEYSADGRDYRATAKISASLARYRVGDSIPVLVNPTNHSDSDVMDSSVSMFTYGFLFLGLFMLAIGGLLLWLALSGQLTME